MSIEKLNELSRDITLLYVEDHEDTREELQELLEMIFPQVYVATNGQEALDIYKNHPIDLIITDINMPVLNGIRMIEKIRENNTDIKVIVFSAHEKIEYLIRCIELSVDGFLTKPFNQKKYFETLYKVIGQIHTKKELALYKENLEKKVQEQLHEIMEKNSMLEKNARLATMGEMIDAIAHQWKSPLSVIKLHIDLLMMKHQMGELNGEELEESMEKMTLQIKHLFETIEEFRKFFRPNTQLEYIKVKSLIDSVSLLLKDELIKHTIQLECEYENEEYGIGVNSNEMKHVLINLIQNSKEAFVQNGVKEKNIHIIVYKKGEKIYIEVSDNAGGIPLEVIDQIFSPHITTKQNEGGTGIGLYLVKQILDKINGTISVRNSEKGACFTLCI